MPGCLQRGDHILQQVLGLDYDQIIGLKLQNVSP